MGSGNHQQEPLTMELDAGVSVSVLMIERGDVPRYSYGVRFAGRMSNSRHILETPHEMEVTVNCNIQSAHLPVLVEKGSRPNLFERNWLRHIKLDWNEIYNKVQASPLNDLGEIIKENAVVFQEGLGTLHGFKATLYVALKVPPRCYKARPVPYALREKID